MAFSLERTVAVLTDVVARFRPDNITFIDDDFFIDIPKVKKILAYILERKAADPGGVWGKLTFNFRGVRVDELDRADDDFFDLLVRADTRHMHIGAESGSQRMLELMKKKITVEQTIRVNRRLVRYPALIPSYNFFSGLPTETYADLLASGRLILQLVRENPYCQIVGFAQFTPWPGSEMYKLAVQHGFSEPQSLEEWGGIDDADNARKLPWLEPRFVRKIELMYTAAIFVDRKIVRMTDGHTLAGMLYRLAYYLYHPIARYRFTGGPNLLPVEAWLFRLLTGVMNRVLQ